MSRIAIKLGSRFLQGCAEDGDHLTLNMMLRDVAALRKHGHEIILLTAGAAIWGRRIFGRGDAFEVEEPRNIQRGTRKRFLKEQLLSAIGQYALIADCASVLHSNGITVAHAIITRHDLSDQTRYENLRQVMLNALKLGVVPILSVNNVLSTEELGSDESDHLACILAAALQADRLVLMTGQEEWLTSVCEGQTGVVYDLGDERLERDSRRVTESIPRPNAHNSFEVAALVTSFGIEMTVIDGTRDGALRHLLLEGKAVGASFRARGSKLRQRKSWIALAASSRGEIIVSTFLAEALMAKRPASILLIGVEGVKGAFYENDVVTVKDLQGQILGRGEVRMSSEELGRKLRDRTAGVTGKLDGVEVILCDYFVASPN